MNEQLYYYRAIVTAVYDGDTCTVDIDLGLGIWVHGEKLRLHRINAPEVRGAEREAGKISGDFLRSLLEGKEVVVETIKDGKGKYGRYLAEIWLQQEPKVWTNINDLMVEKGYAEYKQY